MPLVVDVETVTGGVILEIRDETRHVDDGHVVRIGEWANYRRAVDDAELIEVLVATVAEIRLVLDGIDDWRRPGERDDQYGLDLVADAAAIRVLTGAGLGVLSEESGRHHPDREICVVVDPVDGSTNASRGIPHYATSVAAVDVDGVRAAVVVNQATGVRYDAVRGGGSRKDGAAISVAAPTTMGESLIAMNGHAPSHFGWGQYRAFGAAALDLCFVAEGAADGYLDCTGSNHGVWDYLGGLLIVQEAGGVMTDVDDRELCVLEHSARRAPVAASSPELHAAMLAARRSFGVD